MSEDKNFWKSVETISDQQRQLPRELRQMAGVPNQTFRVDRLPGTSTPPTGENPAPKAVEKKSDD